MKNQAEDLELWQEFDKGAKEAKARLDAQTLVYSVIETTFTAQDTAKTTRANADAAATATAAAAAARATRETAIAAATTTVTGLAVTLTGLNTEINI